MLQSAAAARGSRRENLICFPLLRLDIFSTVGAELPLKAPTKLHQNAQTPPEEVLDCRGAEEESHLWGSVLASTLFPLFLSK